MFDWQNWLPALNPELVWIVQVFFIALATALVSFISKHLLKKMAAKVDGYPNSLGRCFTASPGAPDRLGNLAGGSRYCRRCYLCRDSKRHIYLFGFGARGGYTALPDLVCNRHYPRRGRGISRSSDQVDKTTAQAIGKLLRLAVIITAALVILQTLGYSISGVLAMGGVGGIAIGFAAKDLLANFFGGLIIYLDRPFTVGDWIRSPDRKIEGTVEKIGWRMTMIRNFQSQPMYVPNSVFTNVIVENPSRMSNRRIYETIGLRYSDLTSMDKVVTEVQAMLKGHEEIDAEKTMIVNFNEFSDSSVDFFVYCFTKTTQWVKFHEVKQNVMLRIAEIIAANNAEIAFPTSTVHIADAIAIDNS